MTTTPEPPALTTDALLEAARSEESDGEIRALLEHWQRRAVLLNREVRLRDAVIADLTARLEVFEAPDDPQETP